MRTRWFLLLALALTGCSTMTGRSSQPTTAERPPVAAADGVTQARLSELQRQAVMAEAEIKMLRRQLAALQIEVERLADAAERSATAPSPVSSQRAQPRVPEFESSDLEPVRTPPPAAPPTIPGSLPAAPSRAAEGPAAAVAEVPVPPSGQAIYDRGYTLYHQGRYIDAESAFQRFLQAHGDTELADNAQFWIGESRFAREDYMGALLAFQEVLERFPEGNKVADAMLKAGDCMLRLDDGEGGRRRYEEVLQRFPGSAAAAMAEERLNRPPS